jgi:hypothetical protein
MTDIYTPVVRALVAVSLLLASATLMLVAVNTARAADAPAISSCSQETAWLALSSTTPTPEAAPAAVCQSPPYP